MGSSCESCLLKQLLTPSKWQVRNAQRNGALAVIVADSSCLCSDKDCVPDVTLSQCESNEPILADDGSGSDISIPTMLMFKKDADAIKEAVRNKQDVKVEMSWSLSSRTDKVEYQMWTTPTELVSQNFLKSFKNYSIALNGTAHFTPHMYIYDGVKSKCTDSGKNLCDNLCTNEGLYCSTDPDNDLDHGISGADVVTESLRRICIWKNYGETDGVGVEWWDYVDAFFHDCQSEWQFTKEDCINGAYRAANVDGDLINMCMQDSGGLVGDVSNSLLDMAIEAQAQNGIVVIPSILVNSIALRGTLSTRNVFEGVCAGFDKSSKPPVCERCVSSTSDSQMNDCVLAVGESGSLSTKGADEPGASSSPGESESEESSAAVDVAPPVPSTTSVGKAGKDGKKKMKGMMKKKKNGKKAGKKKKGGTSGVRGAGSGSSVDMKESPTETTATTSSTSTSEGTSATRAGLLLLLGGIDALAGMDQAADGDRV